MKRTKVSCGFYWKEILLAEKNRKATNGYIVSSCKTIGWDKEAWQSDMEKLSNMYPQLIRVQKQQSTSMNPGIHIVKEDTQTLITSITTEQASQELYQWSSSCNSEVEKQCCPVLEIALRVSMCKHDKKFDASHEK